MRSMRGTRIVHAAPHSCYPRPNCSWLQTTLASSSVSQSRQSLEPSITRDYHLHALSLLEKKKVSSKLQVLEIIASSPPQLPVSNHVQHEGCPPDADSQFRLSQHTKSLAGLLLASASNVAALRLLIRPSPDLATL